MEIIVEILLQILGWLLQGVAELVLQIFGEIIVELLGHFFKTPLRRLAPIPSWLATIGYLVLGALAGVASLWFLPNLYIGISWLRYANLLLTPLASGLIMGWIGAWRERRGKDVIRLESFTYGFLFALAMAAVRFVWGR